MASTLPPAPPSAQLAVVGLLSVDRVNGGPPRPGGVAWYAARALRALGHPALVATKVGGDEGWLERRLRALGLPVVAQEAAATIAFRIESRPGGGRALTLERRGEPWTEADVRGWLAAPLRRSVCVHAGALSRADFGPEALAALGRGRLLSLDGQGLVRPARTGEVVLDADFDPALLRHVDVLKLADEELEALGLDLGERALGSLGVPEVVVTLGERGSVVYADGLAEHVPAAPLARLDPTGAGDVFAAAYLSFRLRRHGPPSAARCATGTVRALLA